MINITENFIYPQMVSPQQPMLPFGIQQYPSYQQMAPQYIFTQNPQQQQMVQPAPYPPIQPNLQQQQQMVQYNPQQQQQQPTTFQPQFQTSSEQQSQYNTVVSDMEAEREKKIEMENKLKDEKRKKIVRGLAIGGGVLAGLGGMYGLYNSGLLNNDTAGNIGGITSNGENEGTTEDPIPTPQKEKPTQDIESTHTAKMQGPPPQHYVSPRSNPTYITRQPQPNTVVTPQQFIPRRMGQFGRQNFGF